MTSSVIQRWIDIIESDPSEGRIEELDGLLADDAVLEFAATIDDVHVNGVDLIAWSDDERIVSFKVMMRPFEGLQVIMPKMAELLQSI
jgi:hypothetical protein